MKTNKPQAIWRRRGRSMYPANEEAEAVLRSLKDQSEYVGSFHGVRSLQQLRLWWGGLMRLLVDQGIFPNKDAASDLTKIASGHTEIRIFPDTGEVQMVAKSIAFGSLEQHVFNGIFEAAIDVIIERWLPGTRHDEIRQQVFDMIDPPERQSLGRRVTPDLPRKADRAA